MFVSSYVSILLFLGFPILPEIHSDGSFNKLYPILNEYVRDFPKEFRKIPEDRRYRLNEIVYFLEEQQQNEAPWQLLFVSTNQSSVSQMAQVWSKAAAYYFGFTQLDSYSGGLDPEKISLNTITTLEKAGFIIYHSQVGGIDVYRVKYSYNLKPIVTFPKKVDHIKNPGGHFMAVITDQNADLNIQHIEGTYNRLFLEYESPVGYAGTVKETEVYEQRCRQVAVEMFYVFSQLRKRLKG